VAINGPADGASSGAEATARPPHWLNAERIRVYSWTIVAIFGVVYVGWLGLSLPDLVDPRGKPFGYDFIGFWSAAQLALAGRPEAAFDWTAINAVQHAAVASSPDIFFAWFYPPTFLLIVLPFGVLPYPAAVAVFMLCTTALWVALVRRVLPDPRAWIVAAATPAALINLTIGQNAFLTVALAGFALIWLKRRPIAAGVLIGLLAMKPHLAVLFPLAFLAVGRWRTIAAAAATALTFTALSIAVLGWRVFAAFFDNLPLLQRLADSGAASWGKISSPLVFALSLGLPITAAIALQAVVAMFAAGCVWLVWRNCDAAFEAKAATLIAGSLLASPYLLYYDLTWAALAIAWLARLGLRNGFRRGEREIYLLAWAAPALMPPVQMLTSVQIGFPAILLLLIAAVRRAAPPGGVRRPDPAR
jgi:Glycosyltransferase family 87